ncbi:hypothetical protein Nepgr_026220 [Nepenthes gracilis]|uniref:Zinc finger CCCH domain-containing protein 18-like n=1 Tax=Nepenthes gracilis TaxID=150966 RepID=A0AAD3T9D1_NEPGR|nr:hypothetical protein Nepgr_026220 [Nepenthes gracilis]
MDFNDSTKAVFDRIQKIEPENATKIMGYLFLRDNVEREMIRLAFGPDKLILELVQEAKLQLASISKHRVSSPHSPSVPISELPLQYTCFSPNSTRPFPSPATFRVPATPYWEPQLNNEQQPMLNSDYAPFGYPDAGAEEYQLPNHHPQILSSVDQVDPVGAGIGEYPADYYYPEGALGFIDARTCWRSPSLPEFPAKTCHYYVKGFCKHGSNCRYWHGHSATENFSVFGTNLNDLGGEDHVFSPRSLEKLELEITELLKSRRGSPVSIASLPMLYYEKYGKTLQAEGYLTESQRHGRAGYSLTKLLARLNGIQLIDRPHGQHSVVLAEDASKYNIENHSERKDPGPIVSGSRQIYLTFPAESTFTEEDVTNYFSSFGHVEDVRIPCQQKRMFGFVTFASANIVKTVLAKGNPHFVCGARVLVKPYREKSKLIERKYMEKNEHSMYYSGNYWGLEPDYHSTKRGFEAPRFLRRQLMEEQEQALELERRRLSELQLGQKQAYNLPSLSYGMEELNAIEDHSKLAINDLVNVLSSSSSGDDGSRHLMLNYSDHESQGINLPGSPFASPLASSISTVI